MDIFLDRVRDGYWQDIVLPIQALASKEERSKLKRETAPGVTIAGAFERRADNALIKHSGFIAVDLDEVEDINETKSMLCPDPHIYACFTSISGRGLCLVFKINPSKHKESYQGISEHLYNAYGVVTDPTGINISRLRFVSFDPAMYRNEGAVKWTKYPKDKPPRKVDKVIFAKNDFEAILEQIQQRRLNLCENYYEWLRIGFSFADEFGEMGRSYFHLVSQFSSKYNPQIADKQYNALLRAHGRTRTTIATFYYYCKQAGIETYSQRTKTIAYSAAQGKKGGLNAQQVAKNLANFEEITGDDVTGIVQKVMDDNIELHEDGIVDQLELWLRQNYDLRRNVITRMVEDGTKKLEDKELNSIWRAARKVFDKEVSFEMITRLVGSDFVPDYNPFLNFINENIERGKEAAAGRAPSAIEALLSSIETPDPEYLQYFGKKWIVGIISAIEKEHSPLELILVGGEHGTGKTYWFNKLLPVELRQYFAQSDLDDPKDGEILMTKKLIILDDEMGGKSKKDSKRFKRLTSQEVFSIREPYGRTHADLRRLAVLCGTSNEDDVLNDPTGNRRIIPIMVTNILHSVYNSVDKTEVFMEAYHLLEAGFPWKILSAEDKKYLGKHNAIFEEVTSENELIMQFFEKGNIPYTASEIQSKILQKSGLKVILKRLGMELKRLGYEQKRVKKDGNTQRCWMAREISVSVLNTNNTITEEPPFPPYQEPSKDQQQQQSQQQILFNPQNENRNDFF